MRITSFVSLLLIALLAFAQPNKFRFHSYSLEEGLNSSRINVLAEDAYGFLWIGSENGLYRFDSYNFKAFSRTKTSNPGLISNRITALCPLDNGDLLVGTRSGITYFNSKTEQFSELWNKRELGFISEIVSIDDSTFWVGTRGGLYQMRLDSDEFVKYEASEDANSLSSNGIFDLLIDSRKRLWVSTDDGLNLFQPATNDFKVYQDNASDPKSISGNVLREIVEAPDGRILVGTATEGLNALDPTTGSFQLFNHDPADPNSLSTPSAYSILVDSKENIWIGTWANGLNLLDLETGKCIRYVNNPNDAYSIPHNSIKRILESSTGDIWLATDNGGIARLSPSQEQVVRYQNDLNDPNSLSTSYIRSVYEDRNGLLWIGTAQHGLFTYDRNNDQFGVYLKPTDDSRRAKAIGSIWSIDESDNNELWLGTGFGLARLNKKTGKTIFYEPNENDPTSISTNSVLEVLDDGNGNIWAGTWSGGLNRLDLATGEFEHFTHIEGDETSLAGNTVTYIHQDRKGCLWVEADGMLHLLNEDNKTFKRIEISVNRIVEDVNGDFWIASTDGLLKFDTQELVARRISSNTSNALDDSFKNIEMDSFGRLWLGSDKGVVCYDPNEDRVVGQLDKSNGLAGNSISYYVSEFGEQSNKLFFGGIEGLSEMDPSILPLEVEASKIVFTDFLLFNQSAGISDSTQLKSSIHTSNSVMLNYDDYIFAFEFAALNFSQPQKIKYAYQLEGFDNDWISTDYLDRKAVYTNVPPGNYTFKVKCTDSMGNWTDQEASIELKVIPPWWETWWARSIFFIAALLIITIIFRVRLTLLRNQKRQLEVQVEERSSEVLKQKQELEVQALELKKINDQKNKLFSIIAHDLKTPVNTLESVVPLIDPKILKAKNLEDIKHDVSERISSVSSAMENLLVWSKSQLEGEVMQKSHFYLKEIIGEKIKLFKPYAESKEIELEGDAPKGSSVFADHNQVRAVFRNLISNAIKFTPAGGKVAISAITENSHAQISISDTGIGIPKDKLNDLFNVKTSASVGTVGEQGVGLGLIVVKDFVEKNGGSIWVESKEAEGTIFHFTLPIE